jgi:4'-phosphopantetheinyl transferase EntD
LPGRTLADETRVTRLATLFGTPWVVVHEMWFVQDGEGHADLATLYEEEAALVAASVESRRREFVAGRRCARRALSQLGIQDFPLLAGTDRAPIWPGAVVGSITHTVAGGEGYCAVAVAHRRLVASVGLDAEPTAPLPAELWSRVLDPQEQRDARAAAQPGVWARLIFSAKEAVYKALYPLCGRFLDFADVHLDLGPQPGLLQAQLVGAARSLSSPHPLTVRFTMDDALLVTAVLVPAGGSPLAAVTHEVLSDDSVPC